MNEYYYQGFPLKEYCLKNNLDYWKIYHNLYYFKKNYGDNFLDEEQITKIIFKMKERKKFKIIKRLVFLLNKEEIFDDDFYKFVCKDLNISYKKVKAYSLNGYPLKKVILYTYYFGQSLNKKNELFIRKNHLDKVLHYKLEINIYTMIAYYKCGDNKYLENMLSYLEKIGINTVSKLLRSYNYYFDKEKKMDLIQEANFILFSIVNSLAINNLKQFMKYLHLALRKRLNDYLRKNFKYHLEMNENILYNF